MAFPDIFAVLRDEAYGYCRDAGGEIRVNTTTQRPENEGVLWSVPAAEVVESDVGEPTWSTRGGKKTVNYADL